MTAPGDSPRVTEKAAANLRSGPRGISVGQTEKDVQRACWRLLQLTDCDAWWLSQARPTGQTPGIPDLLTFTPDGRMAWIECKAPRTGRQSYHQKRFQQHCERCGITYLLIDDPQQLAHWLRSR